MSDTSTDSGTGTDAGAGAGAEGGTDAAGAGQQNGQGGTGSSTDTVDYKALAAQAAKDKAAADAEAEKWRSLARKHEERAKGNADAANKAKTAEERLAAMEKAMAERDVADVQRAGRMALTEVKAKLASAGLKADDAAGLLDMIEPTSLLKDGEPDTAAIEKLTKSLIKVGGRATPDPDQGRKGGTATDMNSVIRRAAGYQS